MRYEVDEFSFEVPDDFEDQSLNIFFPGSKPQGPLSITIARQARNDQSLSDQSSDLLKALPEMTPGAKVVGHRARTIGNVPAYEGRSQQPDAKVPVYLRHAFVGHYGTLMSFHVSSPRSLNARCDGLAERLYGSLRFRKR